MAKVFASIAFIALCSGAARADSFTDALRQFCSGARMVNAQGTAVRPGTNGARMVTNISGQTAADYRMIWNAARNSRIPECRGIW